MERVNRTAHDEKQRHVSNSPRHEKLISARGISLQNGERDEFERAFVGRGKNDGRGIAGLNGFQPATRTEAPAVTGPKSGKIKFGAGRDQVVAGFEIGCEKGIGDFNAHRMATVILGARIAVPVPKEARERFQRTRFQRATEYIAGRKWRHAVKYDRETLNPVV